MVLDLDLFRVDKGGGGPGAHPRVSGEALQGPGTGGPAGEGRQRVATMQISGRQLEQAEEPMQQDNWRENEEKRASGK